MNNEAEYEALLAGLRIAQDSQLLVNQIKGIYAAKQTLIKDYLEKVKTTLRGFEEYTVEHVRRNQNKKADVLSKLASMTFEHLTKEVLVEILTKRSIEEKEVLEVDMQDRKSWMDPIHEYLLSGLLPEDTKEARKIRIQAPEVAKAIQDCEKCKELSATRKAGTSGAIAAGSTWPFIHWGIHILGPLPMAPGGLQFLAIAVEHSTKFRVPQIISSKEEKHFKEGMFTDLCKGLKVTKSFSPVTEHMEIMHHIDRRLISKYLCHKATLEPNIKFNVRKDVATHEPSLIKRIKESDLSPPKTSNMRKTNQVPKGNLLLKVAQYICPQLKATHEPSLIKRIKESDLSPPKTSNMRKTNQVPKGNLLLKVAQYICPQLKATHEPSLIKRIKESDLSLPKTSKMRKTNQVPKGSLPSKEGTKHLSLLLYKAK
ncbi:reverse transcriptase domain-containing protein [Tanacetum coccineum]